MLEFEAVVTCELRRDSFWGYSTLFFLKAHKPSQNRPLYTNLFSGNVSRKVRVLSIVQASKLVETISPRSDVYSKSQN